MRRRDISRHRDISIVPVLALAVAASASSWAACKTSNGVPSPAPARGAPATPTAPFSPPRADAARRAKLDAVVPKLDALFDAKMKEIGATGLAVAVIVDGEPLYLRAFGVRDLASKTPVNVDNVFRLASLTKSFTALAVLKLRDEGRLALDDPATKYLPELARAAPPTRDSPPITLRMLLTNASGLAYDDLWGAVTFGKTDRELDALVAGGVQISSSPGTLYAYSNLGWALLGRVVERVSKMGYRDYVTQNILRPLGMTSTWWEPAAVPPQRLASGYRADPPAADGGAPVAEPPTYERAFAPAGGLYASLRDYARYVAFNLAAYPPRDDPESGPVRRATLREMHEGQRWAPSGDRDAPLARITDDGLYMVAPSYGFGWLSIRSCAEPRVVHGGYEPGYFGWTVLFPHSRVAYVALATTAPAGNAAQFGVFDILRDAGLLTPDPPIAHRALDDAGAAVASLLDSWSPDLFQRVFDPDSARFPWNLDVRERFAGLARDHGRCRRDGALEVHGPLHGEVRLACERGAVSFDLILSPATPPRLQNAGITEELVPDDRTARAAHEIVAAIRDASDGGLDASLLAPSLDAPRVRRTLRGLAIRYGSCTADRGWIEVRHGLFGRKRSARYRLACTRGPLQLTFTTEPEGGRITSIDARPPHGPYASCWL